MATQRDVQRYILLPPRGTTTESVSGNSHLGGFMASLSHAGTTGVVTASMRVIDSAHENGLKLVEMTPQGLAELRLQAPGVRVVPELFYDTARAPIPQVLSKARTASGAVPSAAQMRFQIGTTGSPVAGAMVVAFTDFANGIGGQGKTRADGSVQITIGAAAKIERLYVYPSHGCWPLMKKNVQLPLAGALQLPAIDLNAPDVLQHFRAHASGKDGAGVKVGIIDTGCGPHPDLVVSGGENTVVGENPGDYADNGDQHGTHVAGIVAARGAAPLGMAGLAPDVTLYAYRVFPKGRSASNYSIAKAIDRAVLDGCDVINMSLGGQGPADPATSSAIADARAAGAVVLCASGNDGLAIVSQPAADPRAIAVGCFGRKGTFPGDTVSASNLGKQIGKPDTLNVIASFSNHGNEIQLAGPGVGVVSTVPGNAWAVMDGTSMACPAVAAMVARLLSANPVILGMARNQERSDAILQLAFQAAHPMGFAPQYVGNGWIK